MTADDSPEARLRTRHVVVQSGWATGLTVIGLGLRYLLVIAVVRLFGAEGLGLYTLAIAIGTGAALAGRLGLDQAAMRFTAMARARDDDAAVRGVLRYTTRASVALATCAAVLLFAASDSIASWFGMGELAPGLRIAALAVPAIALGEVWRDGLRGFQDIRLVAILENGFIPGATLALVFAFSIGGASTATAAIASSALTYWVCAVIAGVALSRETTRLTQRPSYAVGPWTRFALYMGAVGALAFLLQWADQLLIGAMLNASDVGIYAAATRMASVVAIPLVAVGAILGPTFAVLHGSGDPARLRDIYARYTWATLAAGCAIAAGLLLAGPLLLRILGPEFEAAGGVFAILVIGQVVNVSTGSAGLLLGMTGHVRWRVVNAAVAAALTIGLNLALIPILGIVGSAIAGATTLIVVNGMQVIEVRIALGFWGYDPAQARYWLRQAYIVYSSARVAKR